MTRTSWQAIRDEVARRIHARAWPPGQPIPTEAELAAEFGCARATVNRALRELAATGVLDRRRKGGSRVALHPVRQAVLAVPVLRHEIEAIGARHGYRLVGRAMAPAPGEVADAMGLEKDAALVRVRALHLADDAPYVVEDRWIAPDLPGLAAAPFDRVSPNEWLLEHVPYTRAEIDFAAVACGADAAPLLGVAAGTPAFLIRRTTWDGARAITHVALTFAPGHRMRATI